MVFPPLRVPLILPPFPAVFPPVHPLLHHRPYSLVFHIPVVLLAPVSPITTFGFIPSRCFCPLTCTFSVPVSAGFGNISYPTTKPFSLPSCML
jgi:hypothetical protein